MLFRSNVAIPPQPEGNVQKKNRKNLIGGIEPTPNNLQNTKSKKQPQKTTIIASSPDSNNLPEIGIKTNNKKQTITNPPKTEKKLKQTGLNNLKGVKK